MLDSIALPNLPAVINIAAFFLVWLLLWLPIAVPLGRSLRWKPLRKETAESQKLPLVASLYALAPIVLWGAARLDHQSFSSYGLVWSSDTLRSLLLGWGFGVLGLFILYGVQWSWGWVQFRSPALSLDASNPSVKSSDIEVPEKRSDGATLSPRAIVNLSLTTLGLALWISITEELIFRGFLLNQLIRDFSLLWAGTIASLIFALLHLVWESRETVLQLPGLWLMGMVLCLARWVDGGNLGLAIGLHTGWVWVIACLDTTHVLNKTGKAPEWLIGINGKPLAGLIGLILLIATGFSLWGFLR